MFYEYVCPTNASVERSRWNIEFKWKFCEKFHCKIKILKMNQTKNSNFVDRSEEKEKSWHETGKIDMCSQNSASNLYSLLSIWARIGFVANDLSVCGTDLVGQIMWLSVWLGSISMRMQNELLRKPNRFIFFNFCFLHSFIYNQITFDSGSPCSVLSIGGCRQR